MPTTFMSLEDYRSEFRVSEGKWRCIILYYIVLYIHAILFKKKQRENGLIPNIIIGQHNIEVHNEFYLLGFRINIWYQRKCWNQTKYNLSQQMCWWPACSDSIIWRWSIVCKIFRKISFQVKNSSDYFGPIHERKNSGECITGCLAWVGHVQWMEPNFPANTFFVVKFEYIRCTCNSEGVDIFIFSLWKFTHF